MLDLRPPCEHVVRYVLPTFRSLVARELIKKHGFSQVTVAEKLGTTQAAVSQYLHLKRGGKRVKELGSIPLVQFTARKVAQGIATGEFLVTDTVLAFCKLCKALRNQDALKNMEEIKKNIAHKKIMSNSLL